MATCQAITVSGHSDYFSKMRNAVIGVGAALGTFNFGVATGLTAQAIGAGFVAHAALQWWIEKTILKVSARSNRAWPVWKLGRGKKKRQPEGRHHFSPANLKQVPDKPALWHWLAAAEPGWGIPTMMVNRTGAIAIGRAPRDERP